MQDNCSSETIESFPHKFTDMSQVDQLHCCLIILALSGVFLLYTTQTVTWFRLCACQTCYHVWKIECGLFGWGLITSLCLSTCSSLGNTSLPIHELRLLSSDCAGPKGAKLVSLVHTDDDGDTWQTTLYPTGNIEVDRGDRMAIFARPESDGGNINLTNSMLLFLGFSTFSLLQFHSLVNSFIHPPINEEGSFTLVISSY